MPILHSFPLTPQPRRPQASLRVDLAAGHLVGVALLRYTLRVEPIASASTDELVAWMTPALDHYLDPGKAASPAG
jgi:hypothetical protein